MKENNLEFFLKINKLQETKRYAKYPSFTESTSEHTFKLVLIVDYLFHELKLDLDYVKCIKLALYHDFGEIDLESDIDAYEQTNLSKLKDKKKLEEKKINEIVEEYNLPIRDLLDEYEEKETAEARFINACDKLEACIRVLSINKEIMNYDFFATYSDSSIKNFSKLMPIYKKIKNLMKKRYSELGYEWKKEYDEIFKM